MPRIAFKEPKPKRLKTSPQPLDLQKHVKPDWSNVDSINNSTSWTHIRPASASSSFNLNSNSLVKQEDLSNQVEIPSVGHRSINASKTIPGPAIQQITFDNEYSTGEFEQNTWVDTCAPQTVDDLAVHPKKLEELNAVLDPQSKSCVVVVSGPAGAGKSESVKVIARSKGLRVVEFHSPESSVGSTGIMSAFRDFLSGAAIFDRKSTMILVEELPNVFHDETRREFEAVLLDWMRTTPESAEVSQPIVVVAFTEIEVSAQYNEALVVSRILGELLQQNTPHVKFNAPNKTVLLKTLKQASKSDVARNFEAVPDPILQRLAQVGDIRNAITSLELYARTTSPSKSRTIAAKSKGKGKVKAQADDSDIWVRDLPTQLFNAIGKVIWTTQKEGTLEPAVARFEETMSTFNLTILENYTSAKQQRLPLEAGAKVSEWLSEADMIAENHPGASFSTDAQVTGELRTLGALGSAWQIATAVEDSEARRQFVPIRFTQFMRWRRNRLEKQAEMSIKIRNLREFANVSHTTRSLVLDELGFSNQIHPPVPELPDSDSDSGLDSDLEI